jgi:hypothetical protein
MLHIDPHARISLQQVINHAWVANRDELPRLQLTLQDAQLVKVCYHVSRAFHKSFHLIFFGVCLTHLGYSVHKNAH